MRMSAPKLTEAPQPARVPAYADPGLLFDPATYLDGVPHDEFARRRREAPVAWVVEKPLVRRHGERAVTVRGSGYWAVTRHAAIVTASRRRDVFSSSERGPFLPDPKSPQDLAQTRRLLSSMEPPDHTRIRGTVAAAFKPKMIALLRESILRQARGLVDGLRERGEFDVVRDLAAELPLLAIASFIGMPIEDRELLATWSANVVGFDDPDFSATQIEAYKRTFLEINAYALELARAKRQVPGDDLATGLVLDAVDAGELTETEFCSLFLLLVIAGNETTRHLLSGALATLIAWPGERDRLVADPGLVPTAVEELLRHVSPVMQFRRTAVVDTELDGQPIAAGDKVVLYYVSGNRDEAVFADPMRLDLTRRPNPHLSFGQGPHFCLGAALARLEAAAMLEALGPDLARLELAAPPQRLQSNFVNGLKAMPARLRPSAAGGRHV
jgi:cytochrome P450